jgi:hypothetical protein
MVARNTLTFYRDWRNHPMPYKRDLRRFVSKQSMAIAGTFPGRIERCPGVYGFRCFRMSQGFVISYVPQQS